MLEHDIDVDLSHNAILLRRIYALNNRNKAADVPRRPTLIIIRLEEYNYPAATAIAAITLLLSFEMLVLVNLVQSWSPNAMADVAVVSPIGSNTAGQRGRALT